jgi:hypothetical protein
MANPDYNYINKAVLYKLAALFNKLGFNSD